MARLSERDLLDSYYEKLDAFMADLPNAIRYTPDQLIAILSISPKFIEDDKIQFHNLRQDKGVVVSALVYLKAKQDGVDAALLWKLSEVF